MGLPDPVGDGSVDRLPLPVVPLPIVPEESWLVEPVVPVVEDPRLVEPLPIEPEPVVEPTPPEDPEADPEPERLVVLSVVLSFEASPRVVAPEPLVPEPLPVVPLMPVLPDPVPLDPPAAPPLDCAYAKPKVARNTAAARPVPSFLPAVIGNLLGYQNSHRECEDERRWSPKENRWCRRKTLIRR